MLTLCDSTKQFSKKQLLNDHVWMKLGFQQSKRQSWGKKPILRTPRIADGLEKHQLHNCIHPRTLFQYITLTTLAAALSYQIYIHQADNNMTKIKNLLIHRNLPNWSSGPFGYLAPCLFLLYYEHHFYDYQQLEHTRFAFLGTWKEALLCIPVLHK